MTQPSWCRCRSDGNVCDCRMGGLNLKVSDRVIYRSGDGLHFGEVIHVPLPGCRLEELLDRMAPQAPTAEAPEGAPAESVAESAPGGDQPSAPPVPPDAEAGEGDLQEDPAVTRGGEQWGEVLRLAEEADISMATECRRTAGEAYDFCQERITSRGLVMRLVNVERLIDGSKLIFYFTAEGRVDFRALVKDLAGRFRCRVEMRQIGVRNETKILGGLGSCGRELCCATFIRDFQPVSVKMAKEQNLSLNPNKISGLCGRLMCCLAYEFPVYMEYKKDMPKLGKRVKTPQGEGKVVRQNVMAGLVSVLIEGKEYEFASHEVTPAAPPPQPPAKENRSPSRRREPAPGSK